jgi:hypothetical protein
MALHCTALQDTDLELCLLCIVRCTRELYQKVQDKESKVNTDNRESDVSLLLHFKVEFKTLMMQL